MIMFPTKKLLTFATLVCLPVSAAAQFTITLPPTIPTVTLTPSLPSAESRFADYDKSIGNSYLGGSVHAYGGMVRQLQGSYGLANESLEFWATGTLVGHSADVVELSAYAFNQIKNGTQTRSGQISFEVLGSPVINKTFTTSYSIPGTSSTYNLFSTAVSGGVPLASLPLIGPISISVNGNAGCGCSRSTSWSMPSGKADVVISASGNAYAYFDAWVGIGIPSVASAGVGVQGKVLNQSISANATASAVSGLSGGANYALNPISISLYVYGSVFGKKYTNTVTSWSAGSVSKKLM